MIMVTVPKKEYDRMKQLSSAYLKIAEEIAKTERAYPYDDEFIHLLMDQAREDYKKKRFVEAGSVDEALAKFRKR